MSWEYYLINTDKKTLFYLGKNSCWTYLDDMPIFNPDVLRYESEKDLIIDMLNNGAYHPEDTVEFLFTLASEILDFCGEDKVFVWFDCDECVQEYLNNSAYKETKNIVEIAKEVYGYGEE